MARALLPAPSFVRRTSCPPFCFVSEQNCYNVAREPTPTFIRNGAHQETPSRHRFFTCSCSWRTRIRGRVCCDCDGSTIWRWFPLAASRCPGVRGCNDHASFHYRECGKYRRVARITLNVLIFLCACVVLLGLLLVVLGPLH